MLCGVEIAAANRRKWTAKIVKEEALKYSTKIDFSKNSASAYEAARRLGIYDEVTAHMTSKFEWTAAMIKEEAQKHTTRNDFIKSSESAVKAARRLGIYDEVTSHMLCGVEMAADKP